MDFSSLGSGFTVFVNQAAGIISISDGATTFTVGESGVTGTDANLGPGTLLEYFTTISGSQGETIAGGVSGDDLIYGNSGDDILWGDAGNDTLHGNDGNDILDGDAGADLIYGGDGDDEIYGGADNDQLYGGAGNDTIEGNAGDDYIDGGQGADRLFGGDGDDQIQGGAGADEIYGGEGHDTIHGGWEDNAGDTIYGGSGNDLIFAYGGEDVIYGGEDADYIDGGWGDDYAEGGSGNDRILGDKGSDTLLGGTGYDTLTGGAGADVLSGGDDADHIYGAAGDTIYGGEGGDDFDTLYLNANDVASITYTTTESGIVTFNDGGTLEFYEIEQIIQQDRDGIVQGTSSDDAIGQFYFDADGEWIDNDDAPGGGEADVVEAKTGDDTIWSLEGDDSVLAGSGDDLVFAGSGNDTVYGDGDGADLASFASGSAGPATNLTVINSADAPIQLYWINWDGALEPYVIIQPGDSWTQATFTDHNWLLTDLDGNPVQVIEGDANQTIEFGADGLNDTLHGEEGDDVLVGQFGDDHIYGGSGQDTVLGGSGDDNLSGGSGDDTIFGGDGDDTIDGGADADLIVGGAGADSLLGGDGNDIIYGDAVPGAPVTVLNGDFSAGDANWVVGGDGSTFVYSGFMAFNASNSATGGTVEQTITTQAGASYELAFDAFETGFGSGDHMLVVEVLDANGLVLTTQSYLLTDGSSQAITVGFTSTTDDVTIRFTNPSSTETVSTDLAIDNITVTTIEPAGGGNDTISGGDGHDVIYGGGGDDSIFGDSGQDTIYGGDGNDSIHAGHQADLVYGGAGDDTINVGGGLDLAYGGAGNDFLIDETTAELATTLYGGDGNDTIQSGFDDATAFAEYYGDAGDDRFEDRGGDNQTFDGGTGSDTYVVLNGIGNDTVIGGEDVGDTDTDVIDLSALGDGVTVTFTSDEAGTITDGTKTLAFSEIEQIILTEEADMVDASADPNGVIIDGAGGDDTIIGGSGADELYGGEGNDTIFLGGGADTVYGGAGSDTFFVQDGFGGTHINGGADYDLIDLNSLSNGVEVIFTGPNAGTITDRVTGEVMTFENIQHLILTEQDDIVDATLDDGTTYVETRSGDDSLTGSDNGAVYDDYAFDPNGQGNDTFVGGAGDDSLWMGTDHDLAFGGGGNDELYGQEGNDTLFGGDGDDTINGGFDDDSIEGGEGSDLLYGDYDVGGAAVVNGDTVYGGAGQDSFVFDGAAGSDATIILDDGAGTANDGDTFRDVIFVDDTGDGATLSVEGFDYGIDWITTPEAWTGASVTEIAPGNHQVTLTYANGNTQSFDIFHDNGSAFDISDAFAVHSGNDTIEGGTGDDTIYGVGGDDLIFGQDGDDVLWGEDGNDTLFGGAGSDLAYGGDGDDLINTRTPPGTGLPDEGYGAPGNPLYYPGDSDAFNDRDTVYGGAGNDTILTGDDNDLVYGGDGEDSIDAGFDDDLVFGGAGNDTIEGNEGNDTIEGGDGDDLIYGDVSPDNPDYATFQFYDLPNDGTDLAPDNNADSLSGGAGNDTIFGQDDNDTIDGGDGDDLLYGGNDDDLIFGGIGNDTIHGDDGNDTLSGYDGDDVVYGGTGNDYVDGDDGNDQLYGGTGNDELIGDAGQDSLYGGEGNDALYAGADDDLALGGAGDDTIYGGDGDDLLYGGDGNDLIFGDEPSTGGGRFGIFAMNSAGTTGLLANGTYAFNGSADSASVSVTDDEFFFEDINSAGGSVEDSGAPQVLTNDITIGSTTYPAGTEIHAVAQSVIVNTTTGETGQAWLIQIGPTLSGNSYRAFDIAVNDGDQIIWTSSNDPAVQDPIFANTAGLEYADLVQVDGQPLPANDTIHGGTGNDTIHGGIGNDEIYGGTGEDVIYGGDGDDSLRGGEENDTLYGGRDDDSLWGDEGDDLLYGDEGDDVLEGGMGNDTLYGGTGDDTLDGSEGEDQLYGGEGNDLVLGGDGDDTLYGGEGDDTLWGGDDRDTFVLEDGYGTDEIAGGEGGDDHDVIDASALTGDTTVIFSGNEVGTMSTGPDGATFAEIEEIQLGSGNDTVDASATTVGVTVDAGAGDDSILGGAGDDLLDGGEGDDFLVGGAGADTLLGGDGNDTIMVSQGDSAVGGDGDDRFVISEIIGEGPSTITIIGGEGGETNGDTLVLGNGITRSDITFTNEDDNDGGLSGTFTTADGTIVTFSEIENIICFTPGARILTMHGERPVESLSIGDRVVTRDNGLRPIRWIGKRTVRGHGQFAPVSIASHVVGGTGERLLVSPQHRILFCGYQAELLFGQSEVLVPAKHLVNGVDVCIEEQDSITYIHIMFDRHEVIYADGIASESFHAGDIGLGAIADAAREELFAIFPELRSSTGAHGDTARRCLKKHEAQLLRSYMG